MNAGGPMDDVDTPPVELATPRLRLTMPPPSAAERMAQYHVDNRERLAPWSPPDPPGLYSADYWHRRLEQNRREFHEDRSCRLQLPLRDAADGAVIGTVNFTAFVRGPHQSTNLGYGLDQRFQGRGLMSEALRAAIELAFGPLGFHRVAANCLATNERSGRVLRRLGLSVVGHARDDLFIAGAWRDHVLTALYSPDASPPRGRPGIGL